MNLCWESVIDACEGYVLALLLVCLLPGSYTVKEMF